jgi:hypothetical protein
MQPRLGFKRGDVVLVLFPLSEDLTRKLSQANAPGEVPVHEDQRTPEDVYGVWRGRFPVDIDVDGLLKEIRHEWEAEWPEVFQRCNWSVVVTLSPCHLVSRRHLVTLSPCQPVVPRTAPPSPVRRPARPTTARARRPQARQWSDGAGCGVGGQAEASRLPRPHPLAPCADLRIVLVIVG